MTTAAVLMVCMAVIHPSYFILSMMPDFISEPVEPTPGQFDAAAMSRGEPGLPREITWRGTKYQLIETIRTWKTSNFDRGELYLRRHWHEVRTACGKVMVLYCDRQAKKRNKPKQRWWLYSIDTCEEK